MTDVRNVKLVNLDLNSSGSSDEIFQYYRLISYYIRRSSIKICKKNTNGQKYGYVRFSELYLSFGIVLLPERI